VAAHPNFFDDLAAPDAARFAQLERTFGRCQLRQVRRVRVHGEQLAPELGDTHRDSGGARLTVVIGLAQPTGHVGLRHVDPPVAKRLLAVVGAHQHELDELVGVGGIARPVARHNRAHAAAAAAVAAVAVAAADTAAAAAAAAAAATRVTSAVLALEA